MNAEHTHIIISALLAFAGVKFVFATIGWLTRDAEDRVFRGRLDVLFDRLDAIPLGDLARRFLWRFVNRWESTFSGKKGIARFILMSFCGNLAAILLLIRSDFSTLSDPWSRMWFVAAIPAFVIYVLVGLLPDIISGRLSLWLVQFALRRPGNFRIVVMCIMDTLLLFIAVGCNFFIVRVSGYGSSPDNPLLELVDMIGELRESSISLEAWPLFVTASVQTTLYLVLGFCAGLARLCPRRLQSLFARTVYNISVADKPVFSQLGDLCGALAAVLTALGAVLRSS